MFSEAISSISWRWRPSSPLMAAAISGSASARVAWKNESGAEAVFALEEEVIGANISTAASPYGKSGRSRVAVERSICEIPHRPELAKHLRYRPDTYARYGGWGGFQGGS